MRWHKDMLRGFRDNAAYEGGRYLILAILAAVWPTINGIMHVFLDKPWYWKLNGLLIGITAILFVVALWKLARIGKSQAHGMQPGGDHEWRAPQPIVIALAELKTLLNEGRTMLAKYQVDAARNPIFQEVEDYRKRTLDAARQQVFSLTPKDLATFEQPWDQGEVLQAQAEMVDHGFMKDGSPDMTIYCHLWGRVRRLKELISLIESK